MPALDTAAVEQWVAGLPTPTRLEMERIAAIETWVIDPPGKVTPDVEALIEALGTALDLDNNPADVLTGVLDAPGGLSTLRSVLAYMSVQRRMKLFSYLTDHGLADDGLAVLRCEPEDGVDDILAARAIEASLLQFHRREMISRIFSPERLERILAALRPLSDITE